MMGPGVRRTWIGVLLVLVVLLRRLLCVTAADPIGVSMCPIESVADSIFGFRDQSSVMCSGATILDDAVVTEGDEVSLQKVMNMAHKNSQKYVALLFYASWCPFSRTFRPTFSVLSSLYPSIPHFAIEESSIRPSTLSKYGVHGFPTLFLLNSAMWVRYHGSRSPGSLVAFYSDVTGIKNASLDKGPPDRSPSSHDIHDNTEQGSCPFSRARSPENLVRQETYLALATAFVLFRLLHLFFPTLLALAQFVWRRHIQDVRLGSFLEHPRANLNQISLLFESLKEPRKMNNLQGGAINARAWASKSLATVSIGDPSTSRSALLLSTQLWIVESMECYFQ